MLFKLVKDKFSRLVLILCPFSARCPALHAEDHRSEG